MYKPLFYILFIMLLSFNVIALSVTEFNEGEIIYTNTTETDISIDLAQYHLVDKAQFSLITNYDIPCWQINNIDNLTYNCFYNGSQTCDTLNICGLFFNGTNNVNNLAGNVDRWKDGYFYNPNAPNEYTTFTGAGSYIEVNYTKPKNAKGGVWIVQLSGSLGTTKNVTIPTNCIKDIVQLKVNGGQSTTLNMQCHTGSTWTTFNNSYATDSSARLWEEAVVWTNFDHNISLQVYDENDGNLLFNNNVNIGTEYNVSLNTSQIGNTLLSTGTLYSNLTVDNSIYKIYNLLVNYFPQVILNFDSQTTGVLYDENKTIGINGTSFTYNLNNLTISNIKILFNELDGQYNYSQFYEFINDGSTVTIDNLTLIDLYDTVLYIEVLDYGNNPIQNAKVRVSSRLTQYGILDDYDLIGQRLTNDKGQTEIIFDSNEQVAMDVSKDGYRTKTELFTPSMFFVNDNDNRLTIYLEESDSGMNEGNQLYITNRFRDRSSDINGLLYSSTATTVSFNTDYRIGLGYNAKTISEDQLDRFSFTLTSGTDFDTSGTDNIILYIYTDGTLWKNFTITYDSDTPQEITTPSETLNSDYLTYIIALLLIIVAIGVNNVSSSESAGYYTFVTGGAIAPIFSTNFIWVSIVCILGIILQLVTKNMES